jgi:membrane protein
MRLQMRKIGSFLYRVEKRFIADECLLRAAALAFTTLLSLVPLLSVSFTLLSAFPIIRSLSQKIQNYLFTNFIISPTGQDQIVPYIDQFIHQARQLSEIGLLYLIVTAVLVVFNIESAFNAIWRVKKHRHGLSAFLLYWAVLTLIPFTIGLGIAISTYITSLPWVVDATTHLKAVSALLLSLSPFALTFAAFALLYYAMPNCKVPIKACALGGLVAMILFELAKWGFTTYVTQFSSYQLLYGALATIPVFLTWIYISWIIILLGAVVGHEFVSPFVSRKNNNS